jgi:hypothetical protein
MGDTRLRGVVLFRWTARAVLTAAELIRNSPLNPTLRQSSDQITLHVEREEEHWQDD